MAVLSTGQLTLADYAKRKDPDGRVAAVAELLSQSNEILEDAVFVESNQETSHRVTVRTGLPPVYWRSLNQGVPVSKSTTAQVDEGIGMLEAYSRVDKDLAMLNGNTAAFRLSEDKAFLESMNQAQANTMFYGNPGTDPRQYLGLAPRFGTISGAGNAQNILSGGGANGSTSVWLVCWGPETVFCTFPKGSMAGISHKDQGELTVYDGAGNPYQALQTHYQWKNGLVVRDWRYVVRIANISVGDLTALENTQDMVTNPTNATQLLFLMSRALDRIPNMNNGRCAFYMNRTVYSMMRVMALHKSSSVLSIESAMNQFGTPVQWAKFMGVPLRRCDQILNTETAVS